MSALNMPSRTLGVMDNLPFLRALNNECIDLIAIDPPFAANETFTGRPRPAITDAELADEKALAQKHGARHDEGRDTRVRDIWTWDDNVHPDWLSRIEDDYPPVFAVIKAVEACASENEAAYIAFMAVRLIECRRVLKPTGSVYVHCDDHANSYLRMLMDAIFGADNFRNHIIWRRYGSHNDASKKWGRVHDSILFYSQTDEYTWTDNAREPYDPEYIEKAYSYEDERGRYTTAPLHGRGLSGGGYDFEWRGVRDIWRFAKDKLDEMDADGLVHWPKRGRIPRRKVYLDLDKGIPARDLIIDVKPAPASERTGYATQKPLALYERVVKASSNPGDVVLDIFAGCATTAVAAERLGRRWIACDMAYRSWTMLKRRFRQNGIALTDREGMRATDQALGLGLVRDAEVEWGKRARVLGPNDLPKRGDEDPDPFHNLRRTRRTGGRGRRSQSARSASWAGRIPKDEAKTLLVNEFGPYCWGCGWEAPKFPSGEYDLGLLEVDHIWARNDANTDDGGGSDELYNLALLHATCNRVKSNRLTLEELRQKNADEQRLHRNPRDLVHIGKAQQFAHEQILRRGTQLFME